MKDFVNMSFKGRISSGPVFSSASSGALTARFDVAVNPGYKNAGKTFYFRVFCFGPNAEYVKRGYEEKNTFKVGASILISSAKLSLNEIRTRGQDNKEYAENTISFVTAEADNIFCSVYHGKEGEKNSSSKGQPEYQTSAAQEPQQFWNNIQWQPQGRSYNAQANAQQGYACWPDAY